MSNELLDQIIGQHWARLNEQWSREFRIQAGHINYLREIATVSVNLGRRAGHTTYIVENALADDLVVVYNYAHAKEYARLGCRAMAVSIQSNTTPWKGLRLRRLWVDTWSMLSQIPQYEENYLDILYCYPEQIIQLG